MTTLTTMEATSRLTVMIYGYAVKNGRKKKMIYGRRATLQVFSVGDRHLFFKKTTTPAYCDSDLKVRTPKAGAASEKSCCCVAGAPGRLRTGRGIQTR